MLTSKASKVRSQPVLDVAEVRGMRTFLASIEGAIRSQPVLDTAEASFGACERAIMS